MKDYYATEVRNWSGKPPIYLDFDGVMATYDGNFAGPIGVPAPGLRQFLGQLTDKFIVSILTARDVNEVWDWLEEHAFMPYIDDVTNTKPPGFAYVDDRAIQHAGDFTQTLEAIAGYQPHWWG